MHNMNTNVPSIMDNTITEIIKQCKEQAGRYDKNAVLSHLGDYIEEPYDIIESYFDGKHLQRLVRHQIESYNHFITHQIERTIQMFNPMMVRSVNDYIEEHDKYLLNIEINFHNFRLMTPQIHENNGATKTMYPQEAKIRNFTYASTMNIDIHVKYIIQDDMKMTSSRTIEKVFPNINIGRLPIMVKSSACVLNHNKCEHPSVHDDCHMDCGGYFIIKGSEKTVLGQERVAENKIYCFENKSTTKWSMCAEIK